MKSTIRRPGRSLTVIRGPCSSRRCVLYLEGRLRAPLDGELRHNVRGLLHRGERILVLDLSGVTRIDAAGVSELVRAYNIASQANALLHIEHATPWVREILERVGLFAILSAGLKATIRGCA